MLRSNYMPAFVGIVAMLTVVTFAVYVLNPPPEKKPTRKHCTGYTVLPNNAVLMCNGDTVKNYSWKPKNK